ncbi:MAG: hypothetical protein IT359_16315 [Gemmatimonadaceae bacterium]|nr:hypothetical protein [Gemmatimonadaceae bacterium]
MQARTKHGLQTMRAAHAFLSARTFTAAMGDLKPQVEVLAAIVARIGDQATTQDASASAAQAATALKRSLASTLRLEYVRPIARIAGKLFPEDVELRRSFVKEPPRDDEGLIQLASAFAERAEQYKELFVARGLAPDFVERLEKAIDDFRDVLVVRALEQARRASASVALLEELSRGRDQVRLVDAMLAPRLASRPEQLAEWRRITRFARARAADEGSPAPGASAGAGAAPVSPSLPSQPVASGAGTAAVSGVQPAGETSSTTPNVTPEAKAA